MRNKLRFVLFSLIVIFGLTNISFAEDQSNLAKFVVRNYDLQDVPNVGSDNTDYVLVEFFDYRCGYCSIHAYDYA